MTLREHDPKAYAKACRPHESPEAAKAAVEAFFAAVYKARAKYRIPDGVVVVTTLARDGEKIAQEGCSFTFGSMATCERISASIGLTALKRLAEGRSA